MSVEQLLITMSEKGKLPRGKHEIGFKELSWSKKELDDFVKKCRNSTLLHSKKHSLA